MNKNITMHLTNRNKYYAFKKMNRIKFTFLYDIKNKVGKICSRDED